jgi:hypothetical protein
MKYIKFELINNGDGTYTPKYFDADDGITKEEQDAFNLSAKALREAEEEKPIL